MKKTTELLKEMVRVFSYHMDNDHCHVFSEEGKQLIKEVKEYLNGASLQQPPKEIQCRKLCINQAASILKAFPLGQAIQQIKSKLTGQPETVEIEGDLYVGINAPTPALPDEGEDYTEEFNKWWDKITAKSDQWTTLERSAAYTAYVYAKRNQTK